MENDMSKSLNVTSMETLEKSVTDVQTFGNPGAWKLICKAWSEEQGWMRSTKAMEIPGVGCLVQVSTSQENSEITGYGGEPDIPEDEIDQDELDELIADPDEVYLTKNGNFSLAEAIAYVPGVCIKEEKVGEEVVFRALVPISPIDYRTIERDQMKELIREVLQENGTSE